MSIIANIKWYIGGGDRWVVTPSISLWSYEELIWTSNYNDTLTELNSNAEAYYNKLNDEWHIYIMRAWLYEPFCDYDWYFLSKDWSAMYSWRKHSFISIWYDIVHNLRFDMWDGAGSCWSILPS